MNSLSKILVALFLVTNIISAEASSQSNKVAKDLSQSMTGVVEFLVKSTPNKGVNFSAVKKKFQQNFSKLLTQRFTENELLAIDATYQKIGGENIVKMSRIMMQEYIHILQNTSRLKDIQLNITSTYDSLIEAKFEEERMGDNLRDFYLKDHSRKKTSDKKLNKEANSFALIVKKHLKKVLSENFTEEQYRASYDFDHSELGKRFYDVVGESMSMASK